MEKTTGEELIALHNQYSKLLKAVNGMDQNTINDLKETLSQELAFIKYIKHKTHWTDKEHDGFKRVAELDKNENGFFKDKYGNRIAYNGIRTLKRAKAELPENILHEIEYIKCQEDYKYFRSYYCLITTKTGLARPEPRDYQENLEDELLSLEDLIILFPRQSGKTVTVATYLLWLAIFHSTAINIGIVANKGSTAREVLDKIKKIFQELPLWMMAGIEAWNKASIELDNGTRIMTDSPSSDSFRGYTINILYEDESAYINGKLYQEYVDSVYPTMNSLIFKQVINSSTPRGMNHYYHLCMGATQSNKMVVPEELEVDKDDIIEIGGNGLNYTAEELYNLISDRHVRRI